jgi:hypothetical protein
VRGVVDFVAAAFLEAAFGAAFAAVARGLVAFAVAAAVGFRAGFAFGAGLALAAGFAAVFLVVPGFAALRRGFGLSSGALGVRAMAASYGWASVHQVGTVRAIPV